jgi:hypothetical protein
MIGIALMACVIVLCLFVGLLHRRFHPENCTAIRPGMTLNEVEDLLGGPPGDYGWLWFGSSAMTLEGVVAPPGSTEMVWLNDDKRIEVYFDKQGRVTVVHQRGWNRRLSTAARRTSYCFARRGRNGERLGQ